MGTLIKRVIDDCDYYIVLSQSKRRPALVIAPLEGNDAILCQITSKTISCPFASAQIDSLKGHTLIPNSTSE